MVCLFVDALTRKKKQKWFRDIFLCQAIYLMNTKMFKMNASTFDFRPSHWYILNIDWIYLLLENFKHVRESKIHTQDINELGSRFKKKHVRNSQSFKIRLTELRKRKDKVSGKSKKGYLAVLNKIMEEEFPWPSSQSQETGNKFLSGAKQKVADLRGPKGFSFGCLLHRSVLWHSDISITWAPVGANNETA